MQFLIVATVFLLGLPTVSLPDIYQRFADVVDGTVPCFHLQLVKINAVEIVLLK